MGGPSQQASRTDNRGITVTVSLPRTSTIKKSTVLPKIQTSRVTIMVLQRLTAMMVKLSSF